MRAIILAAGRGSRMKEHTATQPKSMLLLNGKPLIQHQIDALHAANIQHISVVGGYLHNKIQSNSITEHFINHRWQETNMVRSLMAASAWLSTTPCIISYADIFYSSAAVTSLIEDNTNLAITYDINFSSLWSSRFDQPLSDLETFKLDANHNVIEIGKRPLHLEDVEGQYMGLIKTTPVGWQYIQQVIDTLPSEYIDKLDMTSLLMRVVLAGHPLHGVPYTGLWGEVDHYSDLQLCEQLLTNSSKVAV